MTFLYFCYGSNMLSQRMFINCPSAKKICIALLKNFKFTFQGYAEIWKGAAANIIENPGDSVWGVVWEISKSEEEKLDKQEVNYKSIYVDVEKDDGSILHCKSYQKCEASNGCDQPSVIYKAVVIKGAKEHLLPNAYIQKLENFKDNGYKDQVSVNIEI